MMNPKIKAAWAAALRSDEYTQGSGLLARRKVGGSWCHCSLGVLCELAAQAGVVVGVEVPVLNCGPYRHHPELSPVFKKLYQGRATELPRVVVEWAGLRSDTVLVSLGDGRCSTISRLNDVFYYSFAQIADALESDITL